MDKHRLQKVCAGGGSWQGPGTSEEAETFNKPRKLFIEPMQKEHMCLIAH